MFLPSYRNKGLTFQGEGFNAVGTQVVGKCVIANLACVTSVPVRKKNVLRVVAACKVVDFFMLSLQFACCHNTENRLFVCTGAFTMDDIANVRECFRKCLAINWVITRLFRLLKIRLHEVKSSWLFCVLTKL